MQRSATNCKRALSDPSPNLQCQPRTTQHSPLYLSFAFSVAFSSPHSHPTRTHPPTPSTILERRNLIPTNNAALIVGHGTDRRSRCCWRYSTKVRSSYTYGGTEERRNGGTNERTRTKEVESRKKEGGKEPTTNSERGRK